MLYAASDIEYTGEGILSSADGDCLDRCAAGLDVDQLTFRKRRNCFDADLRKLNLCRKALPLRPEGRPAN